MGDVPNDLALLRTKLNLAVGGYGLPQEAVDLIRVQDETIAAQGTELDRLRNENAEFVKVDEEQINLGHGDIGLIEHYERRSGMPDGGS